MGIEIKVAANGRMVLPADVRKRLGLENGGKLMLNEGEFGLQLSSISQRVAKAQAFYEETSRGMPSFTVDDFLAQKRADAALEKY
ncbi:AbrB family transcriptional regulator [Sphingorhabdus sp. IMCC26285]|uniref:AbrB family transcriptional regulator n=1 Tax=Sphingorhabdus profundilacus TaxID=2509718 RepID=A0A6I4M4S2_9SPHN|nr:AbrB/MazE/SpoVT family DNA-binding domain-containing protein [Sphingorhabdus profundilacus]MVZ97618.1 AbrB family transcriptional regulator [Sphingorhabdus profundilacus]